jgi:TonB family protein
MTSLRTKLRHQLLLDGFIVFLLALLFCGDARPSHAQSKDVASTTRPAGEWNRYRLIDGKFSVLLPAAPALSSYKGRGLWEPNDNRIKALIGAYSEGCGYVISVYETKHSLDDFIQSFRPRTKSEFKRNLKLAGMNGKEYGFSDGAEKGITQFFVSKERTYVFLAQGSSPGNPDVDFPKFFESISFQPPIEGHVIAEGPSEVQSIYSPSPSKEIDPTFSGREVTQRARVLSKPKPAYTEQGREHQIMGTVVLRAVFSATGEVINIRTVSGLPYGLNEKAIDAARQIKFIPAVKEGRFVSTHIQLEYNFNLY